MAGTLSSLGLGSSGALNAETIEKLKANDVKLQIDPIKNKIEFVSQQNQAFDLLNSLMTSLSSSTGGLGSDLLYLDRSTSVTGTAASVSVSSGVSPQNFSLDVTDLATKEIQESDAFASKTSLVATEAGIITVGVGTESFDVDVTAGTTLEELAQLINDKAGTSLKAQVLNVADGDYRLVLTSGDTGADQTITINSAATSDPLVSILATNLTQGVAVQEGTDAHFKFNGIDFIRSTNSVEDIITGVTITLNESGVSNASIIQDSTKIAEEMRGFVDAYNTLFTEIDNVLTSDVEKGTLGVFNGDNTLKNLSREIKNVLFSSDDNNNSLAGFFSVTNASGISESAFQLNESGTLTFKESVFSTKFSEDPAGAEEFLKYSTQTDGSQVDGLFFKLDSFLDQQIGYDGIFTKFGESLNSQITKLETEGLRAQELIDSRYETMFFRFAAYDRIIGGLERQFTALNLQIEAAINAK